MFYVYYLLILASRSDLKNKGERSNHGTGRPRRGVDETATDSREFQKLTRHWNVKRRQTILHPENQMAKQKFSARRSKVVLPTMLV